MCRVYRWCRKHRGCQWDYSRAFHRSTSRSYQGKRQSADFSVHSHPRISGRTYTHTRTHTHTHTHTHSPEHVHVAKHARRHSRPPHPSTVIFLALPPTVCKCLFSLQLSYLNGPPVEGSTCSKPPWVVVLVVVVTGDGGDW